jgi:hypothetical protein
MRIIAFITEALGVRAILEHIGEPVTKVDTGAVAPLRAN